MKRSLVAAFFVFTTAAALADDIGIRVRFGLNDKEATVWNGTVAVAPGRVALIGGWRFAQDDKVNGVSGWTARTRPAVAERRSNNPKKAGGKRAQAAAGGVTMGDNGVLLSFAEVTDQSQVTIKTPQGEMVFKLGDVAFGKVVNQLAGAVELERTAASLPLTDARSDDDYPNAAVAPDGTAWISYASYTPGLDRDERAKSFDQEPADLKYLATAPGGDQLWLRSVKGSVNGAPVAITAAGRDIYKSAVAVDGAGRVWAVWAENAGYKAFPDNGKPSFDIWARSLKDGKLGEPVKLSDSLESDIWPVAATDAKGRVWVAWQGAKDKVFRIFARHQDGEGWSAPAQVSTQSGNCWAPAITAAKDGRLAIAWDTYDKGDYDVWVREFDASGQPGDAQPAANSTDYEARPAMTFDRTGALWISWEQGGPTWGKDFGAYAASGIGLYRSREIGLAIWKEGKWMEPASGFGKALPGGKGKGRRQNNMRVPALEPGSETRKAGEEAEAQKDNQHNNLARIVCDSAGRVWLFARSRQNDFRTPLGSLWFNWATYYDGAQWVGPILVPHSDNLLYNTPAVVALPEGGLLVAHSSDHRQDRHIQRKGAGGGNTSLDSDKDPFDNDLFISRLSQSGDAPPAQLVAAKRTPNAQAAPSPATVAEREAIARCREYRAKVEGTELRLLRGEFHRHTEISGDGGNDGPLEDMWRYAVDVAAMDWLGCGDHDNGGGREYPWWLTQKTTDAFFLPGAFNPMYTYERSVRYPEGHRNVVFAQRGIRTLPRLPISARDFDGHAPDTQMLYKYLHLFGGVCASHTSATSMGTDWRDNDPIVEPMVEIYQGCRQNYEFPGAPRCPTAEDAIGGWEPKGFVNLAFAKGYRFSFEASSDHGSTHISYAMIYAADHSREAIVKAMKQRHTYGATDNIVADYRCTAGGKEYMMGDEFTASEPPQLRVKLMGTAPFAKVTIIKDSVEVETKTPNSDKVEFIWTDPNPTPGKTSYYYVRGEQSDREKQLVWVSPMWIKYEPKK
jgi:hypothetical protein